MLSMYYSRRSEDFVQCWHYYGYWVIFLGRRLDSWKKAFLPVRYILFSIGSLFSFYWVAVSGVESILNGSLLYVPLLTYNMIIPAVLFWNRRYLRDLLLNLDAFWSILSDPRDLALIEEYDRKVRRYAGYLHKLTAAQITYYAIFPLTLDTIFHYIFDWLSSPFIISYPHASSLNATPQWDLTYYAVVFAGSYEIVEILLGLFGWVYMFLVLTGFCYPLILITKNAIRTLAHAHGDRGGPPEALARKAIRCHQLLVQIDIDLKAFLGLPCAFQTVFTSFALTMCLFTVSRSSNIFTILSYGSGGAMYLATGLLYCSLGQLMENESEELLNAVNSIPWYKYGPKFRKDLLMVLRQSQKPFTIDYYGSFRMNLENFTEILRSAYSFFTLLETLTS